jgi:hypothetical protein
VVTEIKGIALLIASDYPPNRPVLRVRRAGVNQLRRRLVEYIALNY